MTHATRDAIEHGVFALNEAIDAHEIPMSLFLELTVARDELQKLLDVGLDADLAALRERCARRLEVFAIGGRQESSGFMADAIRGEPLHPPDDEPYEPKSVMHGDQEAT